MEKISERVDKRKIAIAAVVIAVVIVAVTVILLKFTVFKTEKKKTTEEWLADFTVSLSSFDVAQLYNCQNGQPLSVVKKIIIEENGTTVAEFLQKLEIEKSDDFYRGYLIIEEKYPTLTDVEDDLQDEYYFVKDTMYTRRVNSEDTVSSQFESDISVLTEVAKQNIGNASYSLNKAYFSADEPIFERQEEIVLTSEIKEEYISAFFKDNSEAEGISSANIELIISANNKQFKRMTLRYEKGGLNYIVQMRFEQIPAVTEPEWYDAEEMQ